MALRYPPHKQQNVFQFVNENTINIGDGDTVPYNNRTLQKINLSGNGTFFLESAGDDGAVLILIIETVTGSTRLENDTNIILKDRAWLPVDPGEAISFIWNNTLSAWCECWRTQTYDTFTGLFVKNETGVSIAKARAVRIVGGTGNNPLIDLADASSEATSAETIGLTLNEIPHNGFGYVVINGLIDGLNTNSVPNAGDTVYLSTSGTFTATKPVAPTHTVVLGNVVKKSATVGSIEVNVMNGWELDELHNVQIDVSLPVGTGSLLWRDSDNLWKNTDPSDIYVNGNDGRLSIGNSSPSYPLQVNGTAYFEQLVVYKPSTRSLTIDNIVIDPNNSSYIQILSTSATPSQRTFTLSNGLVAGQLLIITITVNAAELQDTGNVRLAGTWTAGVNDSITLIWSGSAWIETSRSNN